MQQSKKTHRTNKELHHCTWCKDQKYQDLLAGISCIRDPQKSSCDKSLNEPFKSINIYCLAIINDELF